MVDSFPDLINTYIYGTGKRKPATQVLYKASLDSLLTWIEEEGVEPFSLNISQMSRFEQRLRDDQLAQNTILSRTRVTKSFYKWLHEQGHIERSGLTNYQLPLRQPYIRDTLSVPELRAMWQATDYPLDRVVLGLLAFNGLKNGDIVGADVRDLTEQDGIPVLHLKARTNRFPFTPLTPPVHKNIVSYLDGRSDGPLLRSRQNRRADRRVLDAIIGRLGRKSKVGRDITPLTVTLSSRDISVDRGFSFAAVMRGAGVREPGKLETLAARANLSLTADGAARMTRLVTEDDDSTYALLLQAEVLAAESDNHPSLPVMLIGATLERHLRLMSRMRGIGVNEEAATIGLYVAKLREVKAITKGEVQRLSSIAFTRNQADHGWFDEISMSDVTPMLREVRNFIARHPAP